MTARVPLFWGSLISCFFIWGITTSLGLVESLEITRTSWSPPWSSAGGWSGWTTPTDNRRAREISNRTRRDQKERKKEKKKKVHTRFVITRLACGTSTDLQNLKLPGLDVFSFCPILVLYVLGTCMYLLTRHVDFFGLVRNFPPRSSDEIMGRTDGRTRERKKKQWRVPAFWFTYDTHTGGVCIRYSDIYMYMYALSLMLSLTGTLDIHM